MEHKRIIVYYPKIFSFVFFAAAIAAIGVPLYWMLVPTMNKVGSIITIAFSDYLVLLLLAALSILLGIAFSRWKIIAGDQIEITPYFGKTKILQYDEIVRIKKILLTSTALYTKEKRVALIEQNALNQTEFFSRLKNHHKEINY